MTFQITHTNKKIAQIAAQTMRKQINKFKKGIIFYYRTTPWLFLPVSTRRSRPKLNMSWTTTTRHTRTGYTASCPYIVAQCAYYKNRFEYNSRTHPLEPQPAATPPKTAQIFSSPFFLSQKKKKNFTSHLFHYCYF